MKKILTVFAIMTVFGVFFSPAAHAGSADVHSVAKSTGIAVSTMSWTAIPNIAGMDRSRIGLYLSALKYADLLVVVSSPMASLSTVDVSTNDASMRITPGTAPQFLPVSSEVYVWAHSTGTVVEKAFAQEVNGK